MTVLVRSKAGIDPTGSHWPDHGQMSAADPDCAARFDVVPQMQVKLRTLPSGDAHEFADIGSFLRRCAECLP
jgi:hypothetical protein